MNDEKEVQLIKEAINSTDGIDDSHMTFLALRLLYQQGKREGLKEGFNVMRGKLDEWS